MIQDVIFNSITKQFIKRQTEMSSFGNEAFSIFLLPLSIAQRDAMEFLYAYMPLNDIADYDGAFFLKQVDSSLEARKTFSWGETIPDVIFRHFVLPCRVNNENLDLARIMFFKELKNRIIHMSMKEAALEVNHWCHEKVTYSGSDERTSAPLASVLNAIGRCGEESIFTVSALRSVGIPARQCYTPRWSHSDDNHAWVEVWIDGKWFFMSACDPEADLNMGWLAGPAKRAMMVLCTVFGDYQGPEEVNQSGSWFTRINLLSHYAPVKKIFVKVIDVSGQPVNKARVNFELYNYAEFYTIAFKITDLEGMVSLTTGYGDLLCWTTNGTNYAYSKINIENTDTHTLTLNQNENKEYTEDFDLISPIARSVAEGDQKGGKMNAARLKQEDAIYTAYLSTFMTPGQAEVLARSLRLNADSVRELISKSRGNYPEINNYLRQGAGIDKNMLTLPLLNVLSDKDLRDTPAAVLLDHLTNASKVKPLESLSAQQYAEFILSPRISNEMLSSWRSFLYKHFSIDFIGNDVIVAGLIKAWIQKNIKLNETENYFNVPITPIGVYQLRQADIQSRNIFFVAVCRTFGFPSRLDEVLGIPQYYSNGKWVNVIFEVTGNEKAEPGKLQLENSSTNVIKPVYFTHFTLGKLQGGDFVTLDFEYCDEMKSLPATIDLASGYYRMVTGNRMNNGNVLARTTYFNIVPGRIVKQVVALRPLIMKFEVLGIIDMQLTFSMFNSRKVSLKELAGDKGLVLSLLDPSREPSRHVMADIPLFKDSFEKWNGGMAYLVPDDMLTDAFTSKNYPDLPLQSVFGKDDNRALVNTISQYTNTRFDNDFPLIVVITPKGEIIFLSEGYRIGIGENLIKTIQILSKEVYRINKKLLN